VNTKRYLLPLVLLIALAVRLWGLGFGLPHIIARPDETEIAGPAVGFLSGDLRPPYFEWPTLFTYTTALMYVIYFLVTRPFTGYASLAAFAESRRQSVSPFLYMTRALSVVMGTLTVWWVYAIARKVFDETIALVASLFLALAFLHVRDSHFGVTDVAMTGLVVLTVLLILRWRETGSIAGAAAAGLVGGLAGSTKYNGLGVCVPFAVAALQRGVDASRTQNASYAFRQTARDIAIFTVCLLAAFFGASPYILIDWPRFLTAINGVSTHLIEGHGVLVGRGWSYYARILLPAAIGMPMYISAAVGVAGLLTTRFRDGSVLFAFPIAYYVLAGRGYTVFARYMIPVIPFLCIAAAWTVVAIVRSLTTNSTPAVRRLALAAASLAVVAPSAYKTLALDRLLGTTDNRVVVARALSQLLPPDSSIYQSGEKYGYVPMTIDGHQLAHVAQYDIEAGRFEEEPEWILLQRSPLVLYSPVPPQLKRLVKEHYSLVREFPVAENMSGVMYDQQDAFYVPLSGLDRIKRPGPAFELYRKSRP